jgi:purine-binding chemotaxis protein CheW
MENLTNIFEKMKSESNVNNETLKNNLIQLVTFFIGEEIYAINILKIQEIIRLTEITRVPNADNYIKGVINLRGKIIPIIDLRERLEMPFRNRDEETRIVVIEHNDYVIGFIVDKVNHVVRIEKNVLETPPPMVNGLEAEYIESVAKIDNKLIIILDLSRILMKN